VIGGRRRGNGRHKETPASGFLAISVFYPSGTGGGHRRPYGLRKHLSFLELISLESWLCSIIYFSSLFPAPTALGFSPSPG